MGGCAVEVFSAAMRLRGRIELVGPQRLTDAVNRLGDHLELSEATVEPLGAPSPGIGRRQASVVVVKRSIVLICPDEPGAATEGHPALRRPREPRSVAVTTDTWTMVGEVHLEPRIRLRDHLERRRGDFLTVTHLAALWLGAASETRSVQRPFALLNPAALLSIAERA